MALKTSHKVAGASTAAVIAVAVAFTPNWEGMDKVAKRDMIGTGHPITYCYGQTDEFGKVKVGTRFSKAECDVKLAESLPKYLAKVGPAVHVPVPVKTMAALLDAAYNAGPAAVARSPMVAKINAGNIAAGCEAFNGWYVRSAGQVRKGLIARRAGETVGDTRKSERKLCLEGLSDTGPWYQHGVSVAPSKPAVEAPKPSKDHPKAPKAVEAPKAAPAPFYMRFWRWLMETN
jgi:lysozyme